MRSRRGGFSLVELLVVMAIIAIVLAVGIPILSKARLSAEETMVVRAMHTIGQAQTQCCDVAGTGSTGPRRCGRAADGTSDSGEFSVGREERVCVHDDFECRRV